MPFTAFLGQRQLAAGDLAAVIAQVRDLATAGEPVLILDDLTGRPVDLDLRDIPPEPPKPARGRPRLGVIAREVTLLPRHWEWLGAQPGGASATLRRLIDEARRDSVEADRARLAQEAVYGALTRLAGDLPHYEAALRALYARDDAGFDRAIAGWPADLRAYVSRLADHERRARA